VNIGKQAGDDKRLSKVLESKIVEELSNSPSKLGTSPLGPLALSGTRKLLISLISTMNASFPDYDFRYDSFGIFFCDVLLLFPFIVMKYLLKFLFFALFHLSPPPTTQLHTCSTVRADQFRPHPNAAQVQRHVNQVLFDHIAKTDPDCTQKFWKAVDDQIDIEKCEIYSFIPEADSELFTVGKVWSFNFFFYNKEKKMVVFFSAHAESKLHSPKITSSQTSLMDLESSAWRLTPSAMESIEDGDESFY